MKKFIVILLSLYFQSFAISGFTYPWVLKANDTVTYTRWKGNNDTVQVWANRICDTVNRAVVHFNSSLLNHDSVLHFVNIDTIRSAPNIDTIKGNTRFINSITVDSILTATNGFIGNITGNVTGNVTGSSGSCTGNAETVTNGIYTTGTYADPTWITSLDMSKISGTVTAFACTLYENTTYKTSGTGYYQICGKSVTVKFPSLMQTLTGGSQPLVSVPDVLKTTIGADVPVMVINATSTASGRLVLDNTNRWMLTVVGANVFSAGIGGLSGNSITYLKSL